VLRVAFTIAVENISKKRGRKVNGPAASDMAQETPLGYIMNSSNRETAPHARCSSAGAM
jgi:hypothetical protein